VADRVAVLADGQVAALGSMRDLAQSKAPAVQAYFTGPRAHAAADAASASAGRHTTPGAPPAPQAPRGS
jgi:ABC-type transporter Mla maintaining outer membrane lipid asymmetry ATPase subunit MlaF